MQVLSHNWLKFQWLLVDVYPRYIRYLFTYKAHSVIRRTLNFRRRLWQVSKMKISPKYPVIRRTQNYGKFCWPHRCTYNNLLPKVTNYGASIFKTIAKESHMNNSIKVTLFRARNCDSMVANATENWELATKFSELVASLRLAFCPITKESHDTTSVLNCYNRKSIGYGSY